MKNLAIVFALFAGTILAGAQASADQKNSQKNNSAVVCRCVKMDSESSKGYFFLRASYMDRLGKPRELMMGAYATLEACQMNAKRLADLGRCQVR